MERSVERVETPSGHPAWHVVRHAEVKALLGDQRLGRSHPDPANAGRYSKDDIAGRPAGGGSSEHAEHAWWRRTMNKVFSPANLERVTPTVRSLAAAVAEEFAGAAQPAELNGQYSTPLASRVMCALLGTPTNDVDRFREWTEEGAQVTDLERSMTGMRQLMAYAAKLVGRRRADPGEDAVSALIEASRDGSKINQGRVVKLLAGMLAFGRETPASVIDWGTLLLLTNPGQLELLLADPALVAPAVEEILRLFKPHAATDQGLLRYAHADIEVGEVTVHAGDMVLLDVMLANRDEDVFPEPESFDITRVHNPHLTFGFGAYMCNFTRLGRAEIGIGLATLFERFPTLALDQRPDELQIKDHLRTGGLVRLPVTW
ncbi:cytochrome P450 [Solihabitans fulvus]|uniref:Cytochrome P450 n=1 Tax=Solihabitans fulvus TaxID=1892852 RepID=A0A5B2XS58_9PSEU|nr:cytochrome P450 [Solihabitans fulvus]KAA2265772.1 cytochrome P450 [Solihabitans fulvus]